MQYTIGTMIKGIKSKKIYEIVDIKQVQEKIKITIEDKSWIEYDGSYKKHEVYKSTIDANYEVI